MASTMDYHPEVSKHEHDHTSRTKKVMLYGWDTDNLRAVKLAANSSGNLLGGLVTESYDYVGVSYPDTNSEKYRFYTGGAGGTLLATVDIIYADSTKDDLVSIART